MADNSDDDSSVDPRFKSAVVEQADWKDYVNSGKKKEKGGNGEDKGLAKYMEKILEKRLVFHKDIWPSLEGKIGNGTSDLTTEGFLWCTPDNLSLEELSTRVKKRKKRWKSEGDSMKKPYLKAKKAKIKEEKRLETLKKKREVLAENRKQMNERIQRERSETKHSQQQKRLWFQEWYQNYLYRSKRAKKIEKSVKKSLKKSGNAICTLYCVGFPEDYSRDKAQILMERYSGFRNLTFQKKPERPPIVFARFNTIDDSTKCLASLHGLKVEDNKIRVTFAKYELPDKS